MNNQDEFQNKLTAITDSDLITECEDQISLLAKSGGRSHTMTIPPRTNDTDIVLTELVKRFKLNQSRLTSAIQSLVRITVWDEDDDDEHGDVGSYAGKQLSRINHPRIKPPSILLAPEIISINTYRNGQMTALVSYFDPNSKNESNPDPSGFTTMTIPINIRPLQYGPHGGMLVDQSVKGEPVVAAGPGAIESPQGEQTEVTC